MKVFISWSGEESRKVALVLRDWLPSVVQSIDPYVSSEDIDKGARWSSDIAGELEASVYGILCITPDNIDAPWINFEAGALSKSIENSLVTPFLFRTKRSDMKGPLVQFQSALDNKDDVKKLLVSLNNAQGAAALDLQRLEKIFERWWPDLETSLTAIESPKKEVQKKTKEESNRSREDILEEAITLLRQHTLILNDPTRILPPGYIDEIIGTRGRRERDGTSDRALVHVIELLTKMHDMVDGAEELIPAAMIREMLAQIRGPMRYVIDRRGIGDEVIEPVLRRYLRRASKSTSSF
ncbi:TIR domain-containing protein [Agrobacterium tumefaciens]|uniref:TIR domain-containing protein n=1 Tax=Agrobacterium tumefaciens TaxID=358 RepID=UPI000978CE35|nr:hypothetical protein BV900_02475 [Agrobacterium tumefaciens]